MEGRYLPQTDVMLQLRDDGVLGDLRLAVADFGTRGATDPSGRIYNPALGGGALLDLGVYPLWFAHLWLGKPSSITALGTLTSTGVDEQTAILLRYTGGAQALLSTNLLSFTPARASVSGTGRPDRDRTSLVRGARRVRTGEAEGKGDVRLQYVNETPLQFRGGLMPGRLPLSRSTSRTGCSRFTRSTLSPSPSTSWRPWTKSAGRSAR